MAAGALVHIWQGSKKCWAKPVPECDGVKA